MTLGSVPQAVSRKPFDYMMDEVNFLSLISVLTKKWCFAAANTMLYISPYAAHP